MQDISKLSVVDDAERGAEMPLLNPYTGEPTGAVLLVRGGDAPEVTAAVRRAHQKHMETPEAERLPAEKFIEERQRLVAMASIIGWRDFMWKGEVREFSKELLEEVVMWNNSAWLISQVERFSNNRRNFMNGGSND